MEEKLYDIAEVCRILGTTSRTLRFYEEKGIIESTTIPYSSRRRYTEAQMESIRRVLILRGIGMSVRTIRDLQHEGDLNSAVLKRRAELFALLEEKTKEINLLEEALAKLALGENIYSCDPRNTLSEEASARHAIASKCSRAFVEGDASVLYSHLSERMRTYMPLESYEATRSDILSVTGVFLEYGELQADPSAPNVLVHQLYFEKINLSIKYVFHADAIFGLWINYKE